jgi:opacity protein-like surface antigen
MKKIALLISIFFVSLSAIAADNKNNLKTEGHYLGADFIRTKTWYNVTQDYTDTQATYYPSKTFEPASRSTTEGFGFNYKYAVNKNNFFIAPELFFEFNSLGSNRPKGDHTSLQIKKRYGAKANFGYDIANYFSPYVFIGYSYIENIAITGNYDYFSYNFPTTAQKNRNNRSLIGVGFIKHINDKYSLNFEYSEQRFNAKGGLPHGGYWATNQYLKAKIQVMKLGISYNF